MASFGGTLMRGLGGLLGGYNEGMEAERLQRLKDEELRLRQAAEARALAADEQAQKNWDATQRRQRERDRIDLINNEWTPVTQLGSMGNLSGFGMPVDMGPVFDTIAKKRTSNAVEVDGESWAPPLESNRRREDRLRQENLRDTLAARLEAAKIAARARREANSAQQERRAQELAAAEAWWNSADVQGGKVGNVGQMFKKVRQTHPDWTPQQIMLSVQQATDANLRQENVSARTQKTEEGTGGANVFLNALKNGNAAPGGAVPPAASSASPDLPPDVDRAMYDSDPEYRAYVNGLLGRI